ncbi:hypothetical protein ZIOFF_008925 [Zingiber officinale]|uniref:Cell wall hydroxyproline-rich glycoprotein n=1 Tax=Zingiber officinale TaxID=94328 RepID=A0A8J5HTD4_ZINOF|nr:hypothetical protein ZIOFF_008925 [Zingiber officinale]
MEMVEMEAAVGRCLLLLLLLLCLILCYFPFSDGLTDIEAAAITRRQLIALSENEELTKDFEFDIKIDVKIANPRLRRAYVALQAWKDAIYSDPNNFTGNWVGPDICNYNGIVCAPAPDDPSTNVVAGADLNGGDIAGYLPAELGLLTEAALFHINSNRFCGVIPQSFSDLKLLHEFDASNNRFVGPFPDVLLRLPSLKYIDLRFNDFEGPLPSALFEMDLDAIFLNDNRFTSHIPENFGESKASVVVLANNKLGGCIPRSIGKMGATLNELVLLNNGLTGCLPLEIGMLGNSTVVDVSRNSLTGVLTSKSFEGLSMVEELDLSHNNLTGIVPAAICKLPRLASFNFGYNFFKGEAEECLPSGKSDVAYDDSNNCLPNRAEQKSPSLCSPVVNRPVNCSRFECGYPSTPSPVVSRPVKPPPPPRSKLSPPAPYDSSPEKRVHSPPPPATPLQSPPSPYKVSPVTMVHSPPPPVSSPPPPVHSPPPLPVQSPPPPPWVDIATHPHLRPSTKDTTDLVLPRSIAYMNQLPLEHEVHGHAKRRRRTRRECSSE